MKQALRERLADLAKAIGDRQLELRYGRPVIYEHALVDVKAFAEALIAAVNEAQQGEK